MNSREMIKRVIHHDNPERLGWDYHDPRFCDISAGSAVEVLMPEGGRYDEWGEYPELLEKSRFNGEVRLDFCGNIIGRFHGKTKGECVKGILEDGWEGLEHFRLPGIAVRPDHEGKYAASDKYVITGSPISVFSTLRDVRRMSNALMDTIEEPEYVTDFLRRVVEWTLPVIHESAKAGIDAYMLADDWGTQTTTFISPKSFRQLFKPAYAAIADECHNCGMDFILHSCGKVESFVDDLIEAGIDVFQFDQPEISGTDLWAGKYGKKAAFYCPVDIQKILPTGNRELIEKTALHMAEAFKAAGGSLIAKDYGIPSSYNDIDVKREWADWARDIMIENSYL